jgi:hypothetical protein
MSEGSSIIYKENIPLYIWTFPFFFLLEGKGAESKEEECFRGKKIVHDK